MLISKFKTRLNGIIRGIRTVLEDKSRKSIFTMMVEIIQLWCWNRAIPRHYYKNLLYRKDINQNIFAHVGNNHKFAYIHFRDPVKEYAFNHKVLFDLFYRQQGFIVPALLGYNIGNMFVVDGKVTWVFDTQQFLDLVRYMMSNKPNGVVFAKPIIGTCGGRGCLSFCFDDLSRMSEGDVLKLFRNDYVYQEMIIQHPEMAELHPFSVNTLRIDTYRAKKGEVSVMSEYMRIGGGKRCIDNITGGGCVVGVDMETGTLMGRGLITPENGPAVLAEHPDTGVIFGGRKIPFFYEALSVAKRAATKISLSVVGWDVAIGPNGPILIEGNAPYEFRVSEMASGGYWKNPVFRNLIREHAPQLESIAKKFDRAYSDNAL